MKFDHGIQFMFIYSYNQNNFNSSRNENLFSSCGESIQLDLVLNVKVNDQQSKPIFEQYKRKQSKLNVLSERNEKKQNNCKSLIVTRWNHNQEQQSSSNYLK